MHWHGKITDMIILSFEVGWIAKLLGFIRRHHRRSFQLLSRFYGTFIGIALRKFDPFTSLKAVAGGCKKVKYAAQGGPTAVFQKRPQPRTTTTLPKRTSPPRNLQHVLRLLRKLHFLKFNVTRFPTRSLVLVMVKVHHSLSPSLEIWLLHHGDTVVQLQDTNTSKVAQIMPRRIKSNKTCHWNLRRKLQILLLHTFFCHI